MDISADDLNSITSVKIAACGTSWHAGLAGKYMIENLARVPVEVDCVGTHRYRDPVFERKRLLIVISQSGETADTIAAIAKRNRLAARSSRSATFKVR